MDRRLTPLLAIAALVCGCSSGGSTHESTATDTVPVESSPTVPAQSTWPLFGVTPDRRNDFQAPTGITFLGGENPPGTSTDKRVDAFKAGPRASFFNTVFLNAHPTGGHFGYYENPDAVISDIRAMFRPLRA